MIGNEKHNNIKVQYLSLKQKGLINDDCNQAFALDALERLRYAVTYHRDRKPRLLIKGIYLWGEVGRGKTFLLDLFAASLNPKDCLRIHFHHFMKSVHEQLHYYRGHTAPLKIIATKLSKHYKVLCFDEFYVSDIGDAMLLGALLQHLFHLKVTFVATSNTAPENLYPNGLQRSQFLPAIAAIQKNTAIIHLSGPKDHRERPLEQTANYFLTPTPVDIKLLATSETGNEGIEEAIRTRLLHLGLTLNPNHADGLSHLTTLPILGRQIAYLCRNQNSICFEFSQLCEGTRSHLDYIEIANKFSNLILLNVPRLSGHAYERIKARGTEDGSIGSGNTGERQILLAPMDDAARRFIALIDELYERKVSIYLTSTLSIEALYTQGSLLTEFQRTRSRLIEMSSSAYQKLTTSTELRHKTDSVVQLPGQDTP